MTTFRILPPQSFTFAQLDEWPKWIRRFERFQVSSGASNPSEYNGVLHGGRGEQHSFIAGLVRRRKEGLRNSQKQTRGTLCEA